MHICLYGASSEHLSSLYLDAAFEMGQRVADHGHTLVFGGGDKGIMGAAARGARERGGGVVGIAPRFFDVNDILFKDCTEFIYTETMAERKSIMMQKSDAFIMAPGGIGTLEEFFEILTLKQLGRHNPAIAVLNTGNYYGAMQQMLLHTVEQGFAKAAVLEIYRLFDQPTGLLDYLEHFDPDAFDVRHLKNL